MEEDFYEPRNEAHEKGIKVILVNFRTLNSFLTKSAIYLRESMNRIEKRCTLTYELVHHSRTDFNCNDRDLFHSEEEDKEIRKLTANKLVSKTKLYSLLESYYSMDKVAEELEVTKEVLNDYLNLHCEEAYEYITIK